jgi:F-type H+-transporting ATPase subunit delta
VSHSQSEIRAISSRYVTALFAIAQDAATQDAILADLEAIAATVQAHPELARTIANPVFSRKEKINVMAAVLTKLKISDAVVAFVKRLAVNDRLLCLTTIAQLYKERLQTLRGIISVEITSADVLSDAHTKTILSTLEKAAKTTVQAQYKQNPEILGGIMIRQGSQLLDFSLRGKLQRLGSSLKANVVHG